MPGPGSVQADFIIIGGGIAGASIGYFLSLEARVVVLEQESQAGYHTTGRSAALFAESYGSPQVRALTVASRAFLERPPPGFAEHPILSPRGALFAGTPDQQVLLDDLHAQLILQSDAMRRLDARETRALVPVLNPDWVAGGVLDPAAADMDVHTLHQGFLRGLRANGGRLRVDAPVTVLERRGGIWAVQAGGETHEAPVVVNAAGAWADVVAQRAGVAPIGLIPRRRTAFTFAAPQGVAFAAWPTVIGADESFYFKPEAGQLLGSPANADPVVPQDVQPEEEDVATGIFRIEQATSLRIRRPSRAWAGLRSFVSDGDLVGGFDPRVEGFFWCAAQGGYGIQTCAAMGQACAALALGRGLPQHLSALGVTEHMLSPARLAA